MSAFILALVLLVGVAPSSPASTAVVEMKSHPVVGRLSATTSRIDVGEVRGDSWRLRPFRDPSTPVSPDPTAPPPAMTRELAIALAAREFGADARAMLRVSRCENVPGTFDLPGDDGAALGIFQFHLATYLANAKRAGLEVADHRADPLESARVAAWMFSRGHADRWTCR